MSSQSSHHPQEVLLAQFSLYVHKGGLKPDSFHFILRLNSIDSQAHVQCCWKLLYELFICFSKQVCCQMFLEWRNSGDTFDIGRQTVLQPWYSSDEGTIAGCRSAALSHVVTSATSLNCILSSYIECISKPPEYTNRFTLCISRLMIDWYLKYGDYIKRTFLF